MSEQVENKKEAKIEAERREMETFEDETTGLVSVSIYTRISDKVDDEKEYNNLLEKYGEKTWEWLEERIDSDTYEKLQKTSREVDLDADIFKKDGKQYHELTLEFEKDYIDDVGEMATKRELDQAQED